MKPAGNNNFRRILDRGRSPLFVIVTIIIIFVAMPLLYIGSQLIHPPADSWQHIKTYVLGDYIKNSIILTTGTVFFAGILGVFFAWSTARYEWKHKLLVESLLFLPMAIPSYIAGYVYGGIFSHFGSLHRIMDNLGLKPVRIDIFSMGGAIFVFTLVLMPYVMLVARSFFHRMPRSIEESSRLLGRTRVQTFFSIVLPMARGALVGGIILVVLEVLNDYGLVKYFGIPTFSTAIYQTWFGMSDVDGAVRLAASLMGIVLFVLIIEQIIRGKRKVSQSRATSDIGRKRIPGRGYKLAFYLVTSIYLLFALAIPVSQLLWWSFIAGKTVKLNGFTSIIFNTVFLATIVTLLVIISGLLIGNLIRLSPGKISRFYGKVVLLGYSIPASIIAIAVLLFFVSIDKSFSAIYDSLGLGKLFFTGSVIMLIFALTIRFMAIGYNNIEAGYSKLGKRYFEASKTLGKSGIETFFNVDLPMLKTSILAGVILTFVDVLKELPLTLILRPFNFDTLSTRVFTYAGDEMIHEASVYSLIIILVSILALITLTFLKKGERI